MWISLSLSLLMVLSAVTFFLSEEPCEWIETWYNYIQYLPVLFMA